MIGRGSDVTDSVLFKEIFEPLSVTTISGKPCVTKAILNFSMVALDVDVLLETPLSANLAEHTSSLVTVLDHVWFRF